MFFMHMVGGISDLEVEQGRASICHKHMHGPHGHIHLLNVAEWCFVETLKYIQHTYNILQASNPRTPPAETHLPKPTDSFPSPSHRPA